MRTKTFLSKSTLLVTGILLLLAPGMAGPVQGASGEVNTSTSLVVANSTVEVVDHNVGQRTLAVDRALEKAQAENAPIVLLQEVCITDMQEIRRSHPDWTVAWQQDRVRPNCARPRGSDPLPYGTVAIWRGGGDGATRTLTFDQQGGMAPDGTFYNQGAACVLYNQLYRACSTHLSAFDQEVGARQAQQLRAFTSDWVSTGKVVVLGGDFNASPDKAVLTPIYRNDGSGDFFEVSRERGAVCRCGKNTTRPEGGGFQRKIDYIFISAPSWSGARTATITLEETISDHLMLYGTGQIAL